MHPWRLFAVVVAVLAVWSDPGVAQERAAVLVGVGTYHPETTAGTNLKSPPNDLALMQEVLAQYGFRAEDETVLVDEQATRETIMRTVEERLLKLPSGALAVFYFSGHGSKLKGTDSIGSWENETIVPYDGRVRGKPEADIRDAELYGWLKELDRRGVRAAFILDSCYSGGGARNAVGEVKAIPEAVEHPRPPTAAGGHLMRDDQFSGSSSVTVLAASSAFETAGGQMVESSGQWRSTFTGALYDLLLSPAGEPPPATWGAVVRRVTENLTPPGGQPTQTPQAFGALNAPVFGNKPFSNAIPATRMSEAEARLAAGSDLGVTVGSVYKLFGPDQIPWRSSEDYQAKAKITAADKTSAVLGVIDRRQLTSPGLSAVEFDYAIPRFKIKLGLSAGAPLDPFDRQAISAALQAFDAPERTGDPEVNLLLSVTSGGLQLTTPDGRPVGTTIAPADTAAIHDALKQRLADYSRWLRLSAWKRSSPVPAMLSYVMSYRNEGDKKEIDGADLAKARVPAGSLVRLSISNNGVRAVKADALLLRQDFTIDVCPLGVIERNGRLVTEESQLGTGPGAAAWKLVISDPGEKIELAFLRSERNARALRGSLEDELIGVWDDTTTVSRRAISKPGAWRTVDIPFQVVEGAAHPAQDDRAVTGHCLNLAQTSGPLR